MSFEKFLTNMKYTFESPRLTQVKNILQVSYDLDQYKSVTFDFISNSMAAEAPNLPENSPNHQANGVETQGGRRSAPKCGIRDHMEQFLLDSTRTFNRYMMMTRRSYLMGRLNITRKSNYNHRNASATNSVKKEKSIDQIYREIDSLKVKLKEMEDRKASYCVEEGKKIQSNMGY